MNNPLDATEIQVTPPQATPAPKRAMVMNVGDVFESSGRHELGEEIGRGGMGIVYRARDQQLHRAVAIKVLRANLVNSGDSVSRFLLEARITGQLGHPNIPAVHEVGRFADGRPFMVMKLIQGKTLDHLLKDDPENFASHLPAFEQVCQAVGFAHTQGIIHRDLKPQNIMVGDFGEVQVMDWGLAKRMATTTNLVTVAPILRSFPELALDDPIDEIIETDPLDTEKTVAGSVMGTPAYMPPEQAIGDVERINTRADVFGLGAILCVLLTGKPPFVGADTESTRLLAAAGQLDDALLRLRNCGAEPELIAIATKALAAKPEDRYPNGGELAEAIASFRASADERARQADVNRAKAEVEAIAERKQRKVQVGLAGMIILFAVLSSAAFLWYKARREQSMQDSIVRRERMRIGVENQLAQLQRLYKLGLWTEAQSNLDQCEEFLSSDSFPNLQERVDEAQADTTFLEELDEIRLSKSTAGMKSPIVALQYAAAFFKRGLIADHPEAFVATMTNSPVKAMLISHLDDWALSTDDRALQTQLFQLTADMTGEAWRTAILKQWDDAKHLHDFYDAVPATERTPELVTAVARRIAQTGGDGIRVLEDGLLEYPTNFWILLNLGQLYLDQKQYTSAIGALRGAVALRQCPRAWLMLSELYELTGNPSAAQTAKATAARRRSEPSHTMPLFP